MSLGVQCKLTCELWIYSLLALKDQSSVVGSHSKPDGLFFRLDSLQEFLASFTAMQSRGYSYNAIDFCRDM